MNFLESVQTVFKKYVVFKGRATRSEYWYWFLFTFISIMALKMIEGLIWGTASHNLPDGTAIISIKPNDDTLELLFALFIFLPNMAVTIRRLHDSDNSGWWYLMTFTVIGMIPLNIMCAIKGTKGENRFGEDPLPYINEEPFDENMQDSLS